MVFVVQAKSGRPGEGSFRTEKSTRKDAIETAVGLLGQGMGGVTIADESGRVWQPNEFREFFEEGQP